MNKLIPKIGAVIVAVTVFLVCMFLPIGYIMMAAGFQYECCEKRRISSVVCQRIKVINVILQIPVYHRVERIG